MLSQDELLFPDDCVARLSRQGSHALAWRLGGGQGLGLESFSQLARGTVLSVFAELQQLRGLQEKMDVETLGQARAHSRARGAGLGLTSPIMAFLSTNPQLKSHLMFPHKPEFLITAISRLEPQVPRFSCRAAQVVRDSLTYPNCNQADIVPHLTLDRVRRSQLGAQKLDH